MFVVSGRDTAEVLELGEEAFDRVALAIEPFAEAGLSFPIGFRRDVGGRALVLDQRADAIRIIGLVCEHDHGNRCFQATAVQSIRLATALAGCPPASDKNCDRIV